MLVEVTHHAAERYRQRVRGTMDARSEIATRVSEAYDAGRTEDGERGDVLVRDRQRRDLVYVCRPAEGRLLVITLYERGEDAQVPRRFTDALKPDDHRVADGPRRDD